MTEQLDSDSSRRFLLLSLLPDRSIRFHFDNWPRWKTNFPRDSGKPANASELFSLWEQPSEYLTILPTKMSNSKNLNIEFQNEVLRVYILWSGYYWSPDDFDVRRLFFCSRHKSNAECSMSDKLYCGPVDGDFWSDGGAR